MQSESIHIIICDARHHDISSQRSLFSSSFVFIDVERDVFVFATISLNLRRRVVSLASTDAQFTLLVRSILLRERQKRKRKRIRKM